MTKPTRNADRVIVGLSGGVDSSVAAWLLQQAGYRVEGLFMKNWDDDDAEGYCPAEADYQDARAVCDHLEIPLHRVNFAAEYRDRVFRYFLDAYRRGRTPNPDVLCNREIKFRVFRDYAHELGATTIATGHYAGRESGSAGIALLRGTDPGKDQSYFLHTLDQDQLRDARFPLAGYHKAEVRALAGQAGLPNRDKKDSTGICFIGERPLRAFLSRYLAAQPGSIETLEGEAIGRHHGLMFYTLGQRQGLGIGGVRGGDGTPWFVAGKDLERNVLIVVQGGDHPALFHHGLACDAPHWIRPPGPRLPLRCTAKTRYRQPDQAAVVEPLADGGVQVRFERPQRAITPGQSVVFYQGAECLGGGVIRRGTHPLARSSRRPETATSSH